MTDPRNAGGQQGARTISAGLDPAAMARLETMPVRARIIVDGALSGLHRARLRGSSVEFEQHKEYSPGDEIRDIDWKVYAKADRYYVKQFEQESELSALMIVDTSASMSYRGEGTSKLEYAINLVAALSHLLIRQRDKVGLLMFGDPAVDVYVPPRGRPRHLRDLHSVLAGVLERGAHGEESTATTLQRALELCGRRRMLVAVVSDFFDSGDALGKLRQLRARGHDVVVFHVLDRHELDLPFDSLTRFEALEGGRELITHPATIRRQYCARMNRFIDELDDGCVRAGIERLQVVTDAPFEQTVRRFMLGRLRGRAGR